MKRLCARSSLSCGQRHSLATHCPRQRPGLEQWSCGLLTSVPASGRACIWARLRACVTWGLLSCSSSPEAQVLFRRGPLRERCVFVTAASLWHGVVGSHAPDWTCLCLRLPGIPAGSCRGSQPSLQPGRQGTDAPLAVTTRSLCCTRPGGSVGTELTRLCSDRALQLHGRARVPDEPQVLRGGLPDPR